MQLRYDLYSLWSELRDVAIRIQGHGLSKFSIAVDEAGCDK